MSSQSLILSSSTDSINSFTSVPPDDLDKSHFSKLLSKSEVEETVSEQTSQTIFSKFLETKAEKGFRTTDHLKYRYVEFITAKGAWNSIKAFFNLGGLGYFFAGDTSNLDALKTECHFYRQCCTVQQLYRKFNKKPDDNLEALKEAYETILAMADDKDSLQHDQINNILNTHFAKGTSIGTALLEKIATNELTSQEGFNEVSVLNTISGEKFLNKIDELYQQGYRGTVSEEETDVFNVFNERSIIEQSDIKSIVENKGTNGIFMSYARVYRKFAYEDPDFSINLCKTLNSNILVSQIQRKIKQDNKLFLHLIQNSDIEFTIQDLPSAFQSEEFVDELLKMRDTYRTYQNGLALLPEHNLQIEELDKVFQKAKREFEDEKSTTRDCTLDELEMVCEKQSDENLPGLKEYKQLKEEKLRLQKESQELQNEIELRWKYLRTMFVGSNPAHIEGLVGTQKMLTKIVDNNKDEMETAKKKYHEVLEEEKNQLQLALEKGVQQLQFDNFTNNVNNAFVNYQKSLNIFNKKSKELEEIESKRKEVQEEIDLLQPLLYLSSKENTKKHRFEEARDRINKQYKEVIRKNISLTHEEIRKICQHPSTVTLPHSFQSISDKLDEVEYNYDTCKKELDAQNELWQQTVNANAEKLQKLREFGFKFDKNGQIQSFKYGFPDNYEYEVKKDLTDHANLTAKTIKTLQSLATPIGEVRWQHNYNLTSPMTNETPIQVENPWKKPQGTEFYVPSDPWDPRMQNRGLSLSIDQNALLKDLWSEEEEEDDDFVDSSKGEFNPPKASQSINVQRLDTSSNDEGYGFGKHLE